MDFKILIIIPLSTCVLMVNSCGRKNSIEPTYRYGIHGARYTSRGDRWQTHIDGGTDFNGRNRLEVGLGVSFRKREAIWTGNRYNVTIHIDPCFFLSYDLNRDGEFAKDELLTIFGDDEKASLLFTDLDTEPGNGVITEEEFYTKAPLIIADCFNKDS